MDKIYPQGLVQLFKRHGALLLPEYCAASVSVIAKEALIKSNIEQNSPPRRTTALKGFG
jgi:hypothetical protein